MFNYARINDFNICIGVISYTYELTSPEYIRIKYYDTSLVGKEYKDGKWIGSTVEVKPEPSEEELIQAEMLLNQADIIAKQNEQDEVLAEILLNQLEV